MTHNLFARWFGSKPEPKSEPAPPEPEAVPQFPHPMETLKRGDVFFESVSLHPRWPCYVPDQT